MRGHNVVASPVAVIAFAIVALVAFASAAAASSAARPAAATAAAYRSGLLVGVERGQARALAAGPLKGAERLAPGIRYVEVPHDRVSSIEHRIAKRPGIRYVEPNYAVHEAAAPNDPSFGLQWPLVNTGQTVNGVTGTPGADERALPAWEVSTGDPSVVVGVVDSGVDYNHPDLAANIWSNPGGVGGCPAGTHGYNVVAGTCDPMDQDTKYGGHGTHVAGIIGAVGNNGIGVTGVNWDTTILPVKFVNSSGTASTSQLIAALEWLVTAKQSGVNVRVINDSLSLAATASSQALADEIDRLGANDILVITSAGNFGDDNDDPSKRRYPCGYGSPNVICVAASNQNDRLPTWSNYGDNTVDLAAPGANVYSTLRNGGYGFIRGTSMATAEVSGAATLILSSTDLSATALKADILDNVDLLQSLNGKVRTGGRLNVCQAVPACHTESFGKTTIGASAEGLTANRTRVNRYSLTEPAAVRSLMVYLRHTSNSGHQAIEGVVYGDAGGSPGPLLASSNELTFHNTDAGGWYELEFPAPVTLQPGTYWLGLLAGGTSRAARISWDTVANNRASNTRDFASGPSDPFGPATIDDRQMSLYAVYTQPG